MLKHVVYPLYGLLCYAVFFLTFLYAVAFVGNFQVPGAEWLVPRVIDAGGHDLPAATALLVDLGLLSLFAVQHSGMARRGFKAVWTRVLVPKPVERSTYVLLSSLCLIALFVHWAPMTGIVWSVANPVGHQALTVLSLVGWALVLVSTFLINHFELFGLRQVYRNARGLEPAKAVFHVPALYRIVRHPLYLGFVIAFWATPVMTQGHLLFAAVTLAYILVAIRFEERDLVHEFGERYEQYRREVRGLLPLPKSAGAATATPRA
jgi:protein-S-isoprenylcysteine O-methyltransferase Ste14